MIVNEVLRPVQPNELREGLMLAAFLQLGWSKQLFFCISWSLPEELLIATWAISWRLGVYIVVSLTHDWSISSTFFSITFPTKNISKHQLGAPEHIVTPWIYFNLMGYLPKFLASVKTFYISGISAWKKGDSYFYGLSWVSKSIPSKILRAAKSPIHWALFVPWTEGHGLLLMFSPLGLGTKTCICGCDGMWYHQHVSIIACQALVVSMDDRSSLYLGGPRERREVRWVSFFFRGFGKGYNGSEFLVLRGHQDDV